MAGHPASIFALTSGDGGGSRPLRFLLYPEMHHQTPARLFLRSDPLSGSVRCRLSLLQGRRAQTCLPVDEGPLPELQLRMPDNRDTQSNALPLGGVSSWGRVLHNGVEPMARQLPGLHLLREPQPWRGGGPAAGHGTGPTGPMHSARNPQGDRHDADCRRGTRCPCEKRGQADKL